MPRMMHFIAALLISHTATAITPVEQRQLDSMPGKMFAEHRALTTSGKLIEEHQFEDAQVCSACHAEIYQEWRSSIMAHAWDDPIYRALLRKASIATDGALDHFCTGCHTPVGLLTGKVNSAENRKPLNHEAVADDLPGVDCEACHNISGISGLDNGAYIIEALNPKKVKFGPRQDAKSPYHETAYSSLHTSSEICATCHNVTHPFNSVPIERTYDEWYESPYREAGVSCQDCHMPAVSGKAAVMGPVRTNRASHTFAGANTTILEYFGHKENAENARKLLKTSARLELVEPPDEAVANSNVVLAVKVTNSGAGHKLPTGFPEGREVWLDFQVTDANNRVIYRLGQVKDGKTEPGTRNFMVHMGDKDGKKVDVNVWEVTHIMADNRILPKGHAVVEYHFPVPADAKGPLTVSVDLNYWPFSQAFADELLGTGKMNVLIENIARLQQTLPLKSAATVATRD